MLYSRRAFLKNAGTIAGVTATGVLGFPAIGRAGPKVTLTVADGSPRKHVISAQGVEPWMKRVKELTDGAVAFNYFPAGQIAPLPQLLQALNNGIADAVPIPVGYVNNKLPLNEVAMLPGLGQTAQEIASAYGEAMTQGPLAAEYVDNKAHPLWAMAFPPYQIVSTGAPIKTPADFKGKVLRSAGGTMNILIKKLGASPAAIPVSDMYVALQRGTAAGTISSLVSLPPYHVNELMKAASTNASFGTFTNVFAVSARRWKGLPDEIQKAMTQAGKDVQKSAAVYMDRTEAELAKKFANNGIDMFQFSRQQLTNLADELRDVQSAWVDRLASRGLPAKKVLSSYRQRFSA